MTTCTICGRNLTPENEPEGVILVRTMTFGKASTVTVCTEDYHKLPEVVPNPARITWDGWKDINAGSV